MTTADPASFQSALLGMLSLSQGDFLNSQAIHQPAPAATATAAAPYGTTPLTPPGEYSLVCVRACASSLSLTHPLKIVGSPPEEERKLGIFQFSAGSTVADLAHMPTAAAPVGDIAMTSDGT